MFTSPNGVDLLLIKAPGMLSYSDGLFNFGDLSQAWASIYNTFFSYPLNISFDGNQTLQIGDKLTRYCLAESKVYANRSTTVIHSANDIDTSPCSAIENNPEVTHETSYLDQDLLTVNHDLEAYGYYPMTGVKLNISHNAIVYSTWNRTTDYIRPGGALTLDYHMLHYKDGQGDYFLSYGIESIGPIKRNHPVLIREKENSLPAQTNDKVTRIQYRDSSLVLYSGSDVWASVEGLLTFEKSLRQSVSIRAASLADHNESLFEIDLSTSTNETPPLTFKDGKLMMDAVTLTLTENATLISEDSDQQNIREPADHLTIVTDGYVRMGMLSVQSEFRDVDIYDSGIMVTLEDDSVIHVSTKDYFLVMAYDMMIYISKFHV